MQSLLKVLILPEKVLSRSSYRLTAVCLTFPYIAAQMGQVKNFNFQVYKQAETALIRVMTTRNKIRH